MIARLYLLSTVLYIFLKKKIHGVFNLIMNNIMNVHIVNTNPNTEKEKSTTTKQDFEIYLDYYL